MTTSPLKSPEAMNKLKTPEELAKEFIAVTQSIVSFNDQYELIQAPFKREGFAAGISYTREHEVKPLVEALRIANECAVKASMMLNALEYGGVNDPSFKRTKEEFEEAKYHKPDFTALLTLYTNEVK